MKKILFLSLAVILLTACGQPVKKRQKVKDMYATQAERLGFEKGKKVLLLHADDAGLCSEANEAVEKYLLSGDIKSTAAMAPCPAFEEFISWAKKHPSVDVGMHLTHTSEWKTYRWGPVADAAKVPGLIDPDGMLWHEVPDVVMHAKASEVEAEVRAQIEKAKSLGWNPTHLDSHMGTLFGSPEYVKAFLKVAQEYGIPANVIDLSDKEVLEHFRKAGYPMTDEVVKLFDEYRLPKLDNFTSAPNGSTYKEKRENFIKLVKSLKPGLTEIIFHPSVLSENLKTITNSWQQRVWEAELFSDPVVKKFFKDEGIVITNWKEIMDRFKQQNN